MTSDDRIINQQATLKGNASAGPITSGCSESEHDTTVERLGKSPTLTTEPQHHGILPAGPRDALPMKAVKYTKEGVVIPSSWMKGWGKAVVAH
ncbi:MAG: hypothetical protein KIT40_02285, partial [Nitrospira sp.]|nr:hypothetical protein [Nitrospira sp.]